MKAHKNFSRFGQLFMLTATFIFLTAGKCDKKPIIESIDETPEVFCPCDQVDIQLNMSPEKRRRPSTLKLKFDPPVLTLTGFADELDASDEQVATHTMPPFDLCQRTTVEMIAGNSAGKDSHSFTFEPETANRLENVRFEKKCESGFLDRWEISHGSIEYSKSFMIYEIWNQPENGIGVVITLPSGESIEIAPNENLVLEKPIPFSTELIIEGDGRCCPGESESDGATDTPPSTCFSEVPDLFFQFTIGCAGHQETLIADISQVRLNETCFEGNVGNAILEFTPYIQYSSGFREFIGETVVFPPQSEGTPTYQNLPVMTWRPVAVNIPIEYPGSDFTYGIHHRLILEGDEDSPYERFIEISSDRLKVGESYVTFGIRPESCIGPLNELRIEFKRPMI